MAENRPSTTSSKSSPTFTELGVPARLVSALAANGVDQPFPIQAATLTHSLAGQDVLGRGRTGSGKTYAFAIPVVARLAASSTRRSPGRPRALILAPTRELATQIEATIAPLAAAASLRSMTIFGGVGKGPQVSGLRSGVDIVIACPGRLADHLAAGNVKLDAVEITVLDEADHMADLGFLPVVRRLMDQTPRSGQRLLFSATLDTGVDVLVKRFLNKPVTVSVDSAQSKVSQMVHHVLHVDPQDRFPVLVDLTAAPGRTLVFTRTKHRARSLARQLVASGVAAVELHGDLAQNARSRNLLAFSEGAARTLVATDIAARGIHVDDITLVVHADPPAEHKAYLHRSGRTARAGAAGTVVTLMTDDQVTDVRALARQAGIAPTTTRLRPGHALLQELAPGERSFSAVPVKTASAAPTGRGRGRRAGGTSSQPTARSGHTAARSGHAAGKGHTATGHVAAGNGRGRSRSGAAGFSASSRVGR